MAKLVRAVFTGHVEAGYLVADSLWAADDPFVKAHPSWFSDDLEPVTNRTAPAPVEQTTAAPGEKRTTRR